MEKPTAEQLRILVQVLAATDALFIPLRGPDWETRVMPANVTIGRREFQEAGVAWLSLAISENERKQAQRDMEACAKRGWIRPIRSKVKTTSVRLTDEGEELARDGIVPTLADSFEALAELATHSKRGSEKSNEKWVPEIEMNNGRGWEGEFARELLWVEQRLLPCLTRGLVAANYDGYGHAYYAVTAAGWEALDEQVLDEQDLDDVATDAEFDGERADHYYTCLKAELTRLRTAPVSPFPKPARLA
jgi:hypothetical protein